MRFELRVYRVKDGALDEWVDEWRTHVLPLRRRYGFEVLGPWLRDDGRFVWVIGHEDFETANAAYYASEERRALSPDPARHLAETEAWLMAPT